MICNSLQSSAGNESRLAIFTSILVDKDSLSWTCSAHL
jgi:hypothetical protein